MWADVKDGQESLPSPLTCCLDVEDEGRREKEDGNRQAKGIQELVNRLALSWWPDD